MTDIASSPLAQGRPSAAARPDWRPWIPIAVATIGATAAVAVGASASPPFSVDSHLAVLLRFMAALKALTAFGAAGLIHWRFRAPIPAATAAAYLVALVPMAVAPGLIWSLSHVALGAICFHAGLFGGLIVSLRDDRVDLARWLPASGRTRR